MRTLTLATLLLSTSLPSIAYAEEANTDTIIVTARKTEERLQDVPVSVRVIDEDELRVRSTIKPADLPGIAPKTSVVNTEVLLTTLHGQFQTDPSLAVDGSVGLYSDDVYVARPYGMNANFLDVKNVQILYGPQGTMFGRNTTGGALLINSNDPELNSTNGKLELTYGRFNEKHATAIGNFSLTDSLAVRIAGDAYGRDHIITNAANNNDFEGKEAYHTRIKALYQPTDNFKTVISGEYYNSTGGNDSRQLIYAWGANAALANPEVQSNVNLSITPQSKVTFGSVSSKTNWGNLTTILGWRKTKVKQAFDMDGSPAFISELLPDVNIEQFSAETNYSGNYQNLKYALGAFYFNEKGDDNLDGYNMNRTFNTMWLFHGNNKSYGTYATLAQDIGKFTVSGGIRYTHDEKVATTRNTFHTAAGVTTGCIYSTATLATGCAVNYSGTFSKVTWSAGVDYHLTDNSMLYAKVGTGYRSGGINSRGANSNTSLPILPETLIEYQVGVKGDQGPVTYDLSAFYNRGKNVQISTIYTAPFPVNVIRNAAETRSYGGEANIRVKVNNNLTLGAHGMIVEPKYVSYIDPSSGADFSSGNFTMVIKKQFSLTGTYKVGNVKLGADYVWTDAYSQTLSSLPMLVARFGATEGTKIYNLNQTPRNGILNLRLDTKISDNLDVSVWGRNVTNKRFFKTSFLVQGQYSSGVANDPATYGVTVGMKF